MMENMDAFFTLHADLPREGPGDAADIAWAAGVAGTGPEARICDAGSGPGGDVDALLQAAPKGQVTAIDAHAPFIDTARNRFRTDPRVTLIAGDMAGLTGPFDFIWSAGAVYFLGIEAALTSWREILAPEGAVAFSEPCLFTDTPSDGAVAFWQGYEPLTDAGGIAAQVRSAGYETLATRRVPDRGWEKYFGPLEARISQLRAGADAALVVVLDEAEAEIAGWRAHKAETGYLLSVVRPT